MHLDQAEVQRISERLGALSIQDKLLASHLAARADDGLICTNMGLLRHQVPGRIEKLCTELHMTYLDPLTWRQYVREAVLLVATPDAPLPVAQSETQERLSAPSRKRGRQKGEAVPFVGRYVRESQRAADPLLAAMYAAVPGLYAFAMKLCRNVESAEELVQDTLTRAYASLPTFQPGANLKSNINAWLFTIARNTHNSDRRHEQREIEDIDGSYASTLVSLPDQVTRLELQDAERMFSELPSEQREAVILISQGYSYEEAAEMAKCALGTIKSRLSRGRAELAKLLKLDLNEFRFHASSEA